MSTVTIIPQPAGMSKESSFDTRMTSTANHGASRVTAKVGFSEFTGRHDIILTTGEGLLAEQNYLEPHEARDLAAALQTLATYLDEVTI